MDAPRRLFAPLPCAVAGGALTLSAVTGVPASVYAVMRELVEPRAVAVVAGASLLVFAAILHIAPPWRWIRALDTVTGHGAYRAPSPLPPNSWLVIGWTALLAVAAAALSASLGWTSAQGDEGWFIGLRGEDGFWETLGAIALCGAGVFFVMAGVGSGPHRRIRWTSVTLAAAMFLGALEEISWGQRLVGFDTPESLRAINVQEEANLHNVGNYWANTLLLLVFLGYVGLLPLLAEVFADVRGLVAFVGLPVPPLAFVPFGLAGAVLGDHPILRSLWPASTWRLSEAREVLFSLAMCGIAMREWIARRNIVVNAAHPATTESAGG